MLIGAQMSKIRNISMDKDNNTHFTIRDNPSFVDSDTDQ